MAFDLASLGIKYFINRWIESKNKIKNKINEYLEAAAKDKYIKNTDVIILEEKILQMIKTTEKLNKSIKKNDSNVDKLIDTSQEYIHLLHEITDRLPYEHLNTLLQLHGTVKEISFGEIQIQHDYEEIALVCIFAADILLSWIYQIILDLEYVNENYQFCQMGIKFLRTAQNSLIKKRYINKNLREFVNIYLTIYKLTAQYFLCKKNLKNMKGITGQLDSIADGFNYVIRKTEDLLKNVQEGKLNENYILSAKIILEHLTALLCEINAVKFNVRGLKSFKNLTNLAESSEMQTGWIYDEWQALHNQLIIDWGLKKFDESEIDYSIADSVILFYGTKLNFDTEIDEIKPFEF